MTPQPHADTTPRLGLPLLHGGQARKHLTHNAALLAVESHIQPSVSRSDLGRPPSSPEDGRRFVVGSPADGLWEGREGQIATHSGHGWTYTAPESGWVVWDQNEGRHIVHRDGAWAPLLSNTTEAPFLGIGGAVADAYNRLASKGGGTLLTHGAEGSHRVAVNRAGGADTASLLFQTGYSGEAEIGLAGGEGFTVKVPGDGSWPTALAVDSATGRVSFPSGGPRTREGGDATVFMSPDGDDTSSGRSEAEAVRHFARAVEIIGGLDGGGNEVAIELAPGRYVDMLNVTRLPLGARKVVVRGRPGEAVSTVVDTPGSTAAVDVSATGTKVELRDLTLIGHVGLLGRYGTNVELHGSVVFGHCPGGELRCFGGRLGVFSETDATGTGASPFVLARIGATVVLVGARLTFAQAPGFADAFAVAEDLSNLGIYNTVVEGAASGRTHRVVGNSVLRVAGGTGLPGDSAGLVESGGQAIL